MNTENVFDDSRTDEAIQHRRRRSVFRLRVMMILILGAILIAGAVHLGPKFRRTSDPAAYPVCGSNLKTIFAHMLIYSNTHRGRYPDSLAELLLVSEYGLRADDLICPSVPDEPSRGATTQEVVQSLEKLGRPDEYALAADRPPMHLSYIYAAKGLTSNSTEDMVLVYEPLSNHPKRAPQMLFGDGSVDAVPREQAAKIIAELKAGHNPPRAEMIK